MSKAQTKASLVAAYNKAAEALGKKPVKGFKSMAVAEQRTKTILKELTKQGKGGKAAKARGPKRDADPLSFLNIKINMPRKSGLPGLILARVTAKGGATMAELEKMVADRDAETGTESVNHYSRVQRWLRHLHFYNSLDLKMKGDKIVGTLPK